MWWALENFADWKPLKSPHFSKLQILQISLQNDKLLTLTF